MTPQVWVWGVGLVRASYMGTPTEVWHLLQRPVPKLPLEQLMGLWVKVVSDLVNTDKVVALHQYMHTCQSYCHTA